LMSRNPFMGVRIQVPYFPLNESRARYLGGSTNLWEDGVGHLTTLILKTAPGCLTVAGHSRELVPYYKRAQKACNLGPYEYDFAYWEDALAHLQLRELPFLERKSLPICGRSSRRHTCVLVRLTEQKLSRRETSILICMQM